jgi:glycosyltransferase involved in cell wall biosynthesis
MTLESTGRPVGEGATPLVSIVIPAYNYAAFLGEAIESVLAQDYPHVELMVLDDGSTDATAGVLAGYRNRFFWETQQNAGQAATLNKGWLMARGDILGYLSADDMLRPGCVRAAVEALSVRPDVVLTYCDFDLIDPRSRAIRTVRTDDFDYRRMVVEFVCAPGPGVFFRRSAFEGAGGWDPALRQMPDYEYWLRLGLLGEFRRIPRTLAAFRVHENSITFAGTPKQSAEEPVRILEKYFGLEGVPATIRREQPKAMSNAYLTSAQLHLRSGRYAEAFRHVRRAAALYPGSLFQLRFLRRIANALFNRMGHRLIWWLRRIGGAGV